MNNQIKNVVNKRVSRNV